ncbi:HpcH/HpaI aldolase family protein [Phyllobacterium zundukense]|uniref:2,4-dihydroxyhept-2-ene-1,7-dioic acid aldolase n=1 Tax=Phyllobacterium zundukense TaxID=1867719 RepID=A0A2N9VVT8_9HYPH|nr:aldolase/citrate lyase family protein [Phyllobacterium zundukense]ATU91341.1 2,4-dihydroxyhept-2-ene-1,7-dioic acid aldolase [Phyllobacterium zundukense]PIO43606.1 2,4-dihydroxyhept-2-ene-1,7-dioic acid aldolase [Phyllobacterium zundukense]
MSLASRLRAGETIYSAWSNLTDPLVMEALCRTPLDAMLLDMQHGAHDTASIVALTGIIRAAQKHTLVRVPVGRFDMASRALDMGAEAVIAPMINSVEDARRFAAAMKYPPLGERSWGQLRGRPGSYGAGGSGSYLREVNEATLSFAMIETRAAYTALDDILAVDGIDGVFVGPSDFSIAWSNGAEVDAGSEAIIEPLTQIAAKAKAAGKLCGIYAATPSLAKRFVGLGYTYIPLSVDTAYVTLGVQSLLDAVKA